jgi:hypothetical protein
LLINVSGVYLVQVSLLLIGQHGLGPWISALASHWLKDYGADCTPTGGKQQIQRLTLSAIQAAGQSAYQCTLIFLL